MSSLIRFVVHRRCWLIALVGCSMFAPAPAHAIRLTWSNGATEFISTQGPQAVLVVKADSAEANLPNTWRLQWTAGWVGISFSAYDPTTACLVDTARVDSIAPPSTPADSAANQSVAYLCSAESTPAATAYFLVNIPAAARGKLKVVALDPADSTAVIESNEVTFNGGVDGGYSPTILSASSTHSSTQLQVTVVGTDLSASTPLRVTSPAGLWSVPLTVTGQAGAPLRARRVGNTFRDSRADVRNSSSTTLTAMADVPALLPEAIVQSGEATGEVAIAPLAADQVEIADASLPDTILFRDPNPAAYPKDFAFYYNVVPSGNAQHPWKGLFHLIYIRHLKNASGDAQEPCLAHAWSDSLRGWRVDTLAFLPGSGWDGVHVWAPSIVQVGNAYQMFYTGVDAGGNQRVGYATTSLLDTTNTSWTRRSSFVFAADSATSWADPSGLGYGGAQQFRDPFLIADPDSAGRYLMFVAGEDKNFGDAGRMIIGVARNRVGTLDRWVNLGAYRATDYTHTGVTIDESPLVMRDSSGTGAWRIFLANAQYNQIGSNSTFFVTETLGASLSDTTLAVSSSPPRGWPSINNLYTYLGSDNSLLGWQACEHLQVGTKAHFFAAYQGDGIGITQAHWDSATGNFVIGYPSLAGVDGQGKVSTARFYVAGYRPGNTDIRFAVESPNRATPRLAIYDVTGRLVRTITDGSTLQGRREYRWDGRSTQGSTVANGVYFGRLTGIGGQRVVRVALVR